MSFLTTSFLKLVLFLFILTNSAFALNGGFIEKKADFVGAIFEIIEEEIIVLTEKAVRDGNIIKLKTVEEIETVKLRKPFCTLTRVFAMNRGVTANHCLSGILRRISNNEQVQLFVTFETNVFTAKNYFPITKVVHQTEPESSAEQYSYRRFFKRLMSKDVSLLNFSQLEFLIRPFAKNDIALIEFDISSLSSSAESAGSIADVSTGEIGLTSDVIGYGRNRALAKGYGSRYSGEVISGINNDKWNISKEIGVGADLNGAGNSIQPGDSGGFIGDKKNKVLYGVILLYPLYFGGNWHLYRKFNSQDANWFRTAAGVLDQVSSTAERMQFSYVPYHQEPLSQTHFRALEALDDK